jgi:hypothetical protein
MQGNATIIRQVLIQLWLLYVYELENSCEKTPPFSVLLKLMGVMGVQ